MQPRPGTLFWCGLQAAAGKAIEHSDLTCDCTGNNSSRCTCNCAYKQHHFHLCAVCISHTGQRECVFLEAPAWWLQGPWVSGKLWPLSQLSFNMCNTAEHHVQQLPSQANAVVTAPCLLLSQLLLVGSENRTRAGVGPLLEQRAPCSCVSCMRLRALQPNTPATARGIRVGRL